MRVNIALFMAIILAGAAFAETDGDKAASPFAFKGGIELGSDVLPTGAAGASETWTKLGFQPDVSFGKIGVGLDLSLRFQLYSASGDAVTVYPGDWVPNYESNGKSFFDVYLPKILYVRYGLKGKDPLFAKLGSIDDLSLGNGFIVGNYSNMKFLPQQRIFGLDLGIDGQLFGFPLVGFEALTGNLARFDVVGGRVFARPFITTELPILKNMQAGVTAVVDTDPYLYATGDAEPVFAWGVDTLVPILSSPVVSLAAFGDIAFDPNQTAGIMLGAGGKLIGFLNYGLQLRVLQDGFIPVYFDANYDLYRAAKYVLMTDSAYESSGDFAAGWYASLGTSFLEDQIVFNAAIDGPFSSIPTEAEEASAGQADYPHAKAIFHFGEGIVGGIYFDASYEKYYIGKESGFFADLVDPTDAVIGLAVNYKTGASVLTLKYDAKYNPDTATFDVSSSISASMKF